MIEYYKRANLVNLLLGLGLLGAGVFLSVSTPMFYLGIILILGSRFLTGVSREKRIKYKLARKQVMKTNPSLTWSSIALNFVVPLALGVMSYYVFGLDYNRAAFVFLGLSALFAIYTNNRFLPYLEENVASTFE